jgi:hypothetical protein
VAVLAEIWMILCECRFFVFLVLVFVPIIAGLVVSGWQWYRWIEENKAVRMVPVREWQWQYWQRYG